MLKHLPVLSSDRLLTEDDPKLKDKLKAALTAVVGKVKEFVSDVKDTVQAWRDNRKN